MFELTRQTVKLSSVNPRAENHGDKKVPAVDLKFEANCPNKDLIYFHPELRQALYKKNDDPDLVEQIDPEELTALRFPKMGPLKWDWEGSGYTTTIDYGLGEKSNIVLGDCKLDGIKITPQNGGTVGIEFRVIAHPEAIDMGRLCEMIQREIEVSVTPPEPSSLGELFKDAA